MADTANAELDILVPSNKEDVFGIGFIDWVLVHFIVNMTHWRLARPIWLVSISFACLPLEHAFRLVLATRSRVSTSLTFVTHVALQFRTLADAMAGFLAKEARLGLLR